MRLLVILLAVSAYAQTYVYPPPPPGPNKGTTLPAACAIGDQFFDTDATPGQQLHHCVAANTWAVAGRDASGNLMIPTTLPGPNATGVTVSPRWGVMRVTPPLNGAGIPVDGLLGLYDFIPGADLTKLYDRSGLGNHGTLVGGASAPQWLSQGLQFTASTTSYVSIPAAAGVSGNAAFTVIAVGRTGQATSTSGAVQTLWSWGGTGTRKVPAMALTGVNPPKSEVRAGGGDNLAADYVSGFLPHVYTVRYTVAGEALAVSVDETTTYSNTKQLGGAPNWDLTNGIYLGVMGATKASPFTGALFGLALWNRVLTDDEVNAVVAIMKTWGTSNPLVVFDGSSLTAGTPLYETSSYPYQAMAGQAYEWHNYGVMGQTSAQASADFDAQIRTLAAAGRKQILVVQGFGNDLLSLTPQQAVDSMARYCAHARLAGFYVIAQTYLPRSDSGTFTTTTRAQANALIAANWQNFADALVDVAADATIGCDACVTNATYFQADQTHLTLAGYGIYAGLVRPAILAVP